VVLGSTGLLVATSASRDTETFQDLDRDLREVGWNVTGIVIPFLPVLNPPDSWSTDRHIGVPFSFRG